MPQIDQDSYVDPRIIVAPTLANLRLNQGGLAASDYSLAVKLGATAVFDAAAVWYAWDPLFTTADNGTTIIKPTAIASASPGRWRAV